MTCPNSGVNLNNKELYDSYQTANPIYGYITECGKECRSGYTEIEQFRVRNNHNNIDYPYCFLGWRRVCRKNQKWEEFPDSLKSLFGLSDVIKEKELKERSIKCCSGQLSGFSECNPKFCKNSTACIDLLKNHCRGENFFNENCQEYLKGLRNSPNQGIIDTLGEEICENYRQGGYSKTRDRDVICGCFNARASTNSSIKSNPVLSGAVMCLNPLCGESGSLRPSQMGDCQINSVVCESKNNQLKLIESGVEQAVIENRCGINLNGSEEETPQDSNQDPNLDSDQNQASSDKGLWGNENLIYFLGGLGLLLLIIIMALVFSNF